MATNPAVEILDTQVLSDNWYVLRKVTFRLRKTDGSWETQSREAYDRGNGATILPYDGTRRTVILTRQFRLPTYVNGNLSGMLIETCAGLLDEENPQQCIVRELQGGNRLRDPTPREGDGSVHVPRLGHGDPALLRRPIHTHTACE